MDVCASAQSNLTTCNAKSKRETIIKKKQPKFLKPSTFHIREINLRLSFGHECFKYHREKTKAHRNI